MHETSKSSARRYSEGAFHTRYFVGRGLDVGAGPDGLSRHCRLFPGITEIIDWDKGDGDAQLLDGLLNASFNFVHSSHCLEHLAAPSTALRNWLRVLKPGGHLIVTVPDEDLYERGTWPSRYGEGHLWSFTIHKAPGASWSPRSMNVTDLLQTFADQIEIERIQLLRDHFDPLLTGDQTMTPRAECAIEFIVRKR